MTDSLSRSAKQCCTRKKPDVTGKCSKRKPPEEMLAQMYEKRKKLENAMLRKNKAFVQAIGREIVRASKFSMAVIKEKSPDAYYAVIDEEDTPEARRVIRKIIKDISSS